MADQIDQLKKQIDDLNKRVAALGGEFFKDIDKAIAGFGGGVKGAEAALKSLRKEMDGLDTDTNYFYNSLKKVTAELKGQKSFNKDITSSYSKLSSIANKLKYDQDGISELSEKELKTLIKKIEIHRKELQQALDFNKDAKAISDLKKESLEAEFNRLTAITKQQGYITEEQDKQANLLASLIDKEDSLSKKITAANTEVNDLLTDQEIGLDKLQNTTQGRLKYEQDIIKTLGISGKIIDSIVGTLGKLGISSEFFENLKDDMRDAARSGSKWEVLMTGIKGIISGVGEALKDPVTQLTIALKILNFFVKAALTANAQSVELGKQLGYGRDRADEFREKLVDIETSTNNLNVTTKNLTEAFGQLSQVTGLAYEFTADQLTTQIKLTKQVGLQAEEAAQVQRFAVLNGKTSEETYKSFVRGLTATRNQLRVGINFKATLAEAVKVSGQLAANLGFNPEIIAKAIVTAKAFGMTLEQVAKAGSALLDFGTSISNELEAELLTGKQLNLERARAAALAGDQVTLAEELAKNMGTAADFAKLNKLQQDSLAKSVGMTSDELAETLRKREEALASGKSLAQVQEEEAREALERQNIQDKFNAAVEKLQSIFGNLMAGPLGSFIDILSDGLNIINSMVPVLKTIGGLYLLIKGYQLTSNILSTSALAATRANYAVKATQMGTEAFITREKTVQSLMDKEGLISRTIYNTQLLAGLVSEQGIAGIKTYASTLDEKNLARKVIMGTYDAAALAAAKVKAAITFLQTKYEKISLNLKQQGLLLTIREAWKSIAAAAMSAYESAAKIPVIGWVLGAAAAGGAIALGASLMSKGDDVLSEGGYGKRTLLAPEGAIRLNDKDTVIAGTNLMDKSIQQPNSNNTSPTQINPTINVAPKIQMPQIDLEPMIAAIKSSTQINPTPQIDLEPMIAAIKSSTQITPAINATPEIQKPQTNLTPTEPSIKPTNQINPTAKTAPGTQMPQIDLESMIAAIDKVKASIDKLYNKDTSINMDGRKVGTTLVQGSYKVA